MGGEYTITYYTFCVNRRTPDVPVNPAHLRKTFPSTNCNRKSLQFEML